MRHMNCRNVRREIEAAGPGRLLSAATMSHLDTCPACETLCRQQRNLYAIVSSLGTVEAPGDFDLRLRARLAAEKRGGSRSLMLGSMSFGLRSAAVAALVLLIGAAFIFVSFRTRPDKQVATGTPSAPQPVTVAAGPKAVNPPSGVTPNANDVVRVTKKDERSPIGVSTSKGPRFVERREVATKQSGKRVGTRDEALSAAKTVRPDDAFPINASYQSVKVSVDDRRGAVRTISLPSVSFGSQRTLSQNSSPLLASSRGDW